MRTSDILKKLNIPRHKLYYLEQKGYIKPKRIPIGEMEAREYSEEEFKKLELIWKYLQSGFKHKIAYQKAMEELQSPKLKLEGQDQKSPDSESPKSEPER
jgi:DNA-binding transcriptional MerR regulator